MGSYVDKRWNTEKAKKEQSRRRCHALAESAENIQAATLARSRHRFRVAAGLHGANNIRRTQYIQKHFIKNYGQMWLFIYSRHKMPSGKQSSSFVIYGQIFSGDLNALWIIGFSNQWFIENLL